MCLANANLSNRSSDVVRYIKAPSRFVTLFRRLTHIAHYKQCNLRILARLVYIGNKRVQTNERLDTEGDIR